MTIVLTLMVIFTLILGYGISGMLVGSKLRTKNKVVKGAAFLLLGNVISVCVMAVTIIVVWPAKF